MELQTDDEVRLQYFKMALALTGVSADERTCDMIMRIFDRLEKLGGDFSVHDAVAIEFQIKNKYAEAVIEPQQNTDNNP